MSDNIFAQLQLLTLSQVGVPDTRDQLTRLTEYMRSLPFQEDQIYQYSLIRELPLDVVNSASCFMVPDDMTVSAIPEEFRDDALGFVQGKYLKYSGRFVIPIKDQKNQVAGFVGWDPFENPKYLDSKTFGYLAKEALFFGNENISEYYRDGYVIVVEGSVCSMYIRGIKLNSLATLGSYLSPYFIEVLRRFGHRCIIITDADDAGTKFRKSANWNLPEARVVQSLIAKDVDDSRKVQNIEDDLRGLVSSPFFTPKYFA